MYTSVYESIPTTTQLQLNNNYNYIYNHNQGPRRSAPEGQRERKEIFCCFFFTAPLMRSPFS